MQANESNPQFTNPLVRSSSPYLRQHAHNPVYWYPWGEEAIARARTEQKPILLSVGYSTCYWCHVMEREVFENLSIASLMNRVCINIKVDREEHPHLDEIYMTARQLMTKEGGWPNNVFLTPELKPFYAGGTFAADESYGKPGFARLIEWIGATWSGQRAEVEALAERVCTDMRYHLVHHKPQVPEPTRIAEQAAQLYALLSQHYDERAGGFFQAPKFPHETYLEFVLEYYRSTGNPESLDMVTSTLARMAAGGIYDQVSCGFHRYAVDRQWYVPHFEKMLYNQAMLARLYTEAACITGSPYFADIARGTLEFVAGPMTSGTGGFYSAIDAETDGVEGAYYAWSVEQLGELLDEQAMRMLQSLYALADIPAFPGHKHPEGKALVLRRPLDEAARVSGYPYAQLAAANGALMNMLLAGRNLRSAPRVDDKIIAGWNGLMIDAFAYAGRVFNRASYTARAQEAADFILEHLMDNNGNLRRVYAAGQAHIPATLEDYAYLIKGLLSLHRAAPDIALLEACKYLEAQVSQRFADGEQGGYFMTEPSEDVLFRIKNSDDSAMPSPNGVMLGNLIDLYELTNDEAYRERARRLTEFFLSGNAKVSVEQSCLMQAALRLERMEQGGSMLALPTDYAQAIAAPRYADDALRMTATLEQSQLPQSPSRVKVRLEIQPGWHINSHEPEDSRLLPTQLDVQGQGIEVIGIEYPQPDSPWQGTQYITAVIHLPEADQRPPVHVRLRFQPCAGQACHRVRDVVISI